MTMRMQDLAALSARSGPAYSTKLELQGAIYLRHHSSLPITQFTTITTTSMEIIHVPLRHPEYDMPLILDLPTLTSPCTIDTKRGYDRKPCLDLT